ncbi:hypothetical protein EVAR_24840_1 [Eumeta japonica]|uniref:Uncharacterized protein n=1 Tax=Eumeta variegata TaxID=151549 RepID=A0A4C1YBL3_EUMVA|nr:hypothetical protein EVAR_24840_1 [Eumeta japonica]
MREYADCGPQRAPARAGAPPPTNTNKASQFADFSYVFVLLTTQSNRASRGRWRRAHAGIQGKEYRNECIGASRRTARCWYNITSDAVSRGLASRKRRAPGQPMNCKLDVKPGIHIRAVEEPARGRVAIEDHDFAFRIKRHDRRIEDSSDINKEKRAAVTVSTGLYYFCYLGPIRWRGRGCGRGGGGRPATAYRIYFGVGPQQEVAFLIVHEVGYLAAAISLKWKAMILNTSAWGRSENASTLHRRPATVQYGRPSGARGGHPRPPEWKRVYAAAVTDSQ